MGVPWKNSSHEKNITRSRPGNLGETCCADPHAGCCGEGERKTRLYPILARSDGTRYLT